MTSTAIHESARVEGDVYHHLENAILTRDLCIELARPAGPPKLSPSGLGSSQARH